MFKLLEKNKDFLSSKKVFLLNRYCKNYIIIKPLVIHKIDTAFYEYEEAVLCVYDLYNRRSIILRCYSDATDINCTLNTGEVIFTENIALANYINEINEKINIINTNSNSLLCRNTQSDIV